mmetsp:Transcript_92261/g.270027  ORF Transcript_92261/g.270027 Transcript_92261/m.270027 type:complete len:251 (-) Transcript_92261:4310-5062(-)
MGPCESSLRSSSRVTNPLIPMPEEQVTCLALAVIAPRCGMPAARDTRCTSAISSPERTDGRSCPQPGQLLSIHWCIAPSSRASPSGTEGGLELQAWSTTVSCFCASARDSWWNIGSGEISPTPATVASPKHARRITRTPERTGIGSPRLRRKGALSLSSIGSDHAATTCKLAAGRPACGAGRPCRSSLLALLQSIASSSGHSSTRACPACGTAKTLGHPDCSLDDPGRRVLSSSPTEENFTSSPPYAYHI